MPKKKGDKGGNPNPVQTEEFKARQFVASDVEPGVKLARKALSVRVEDDVDAWIRSLDNPSQWLRRVITEAARVEMKDSTPTRF